MKILSSLLASAFLVLASASLLAKDMKEIQLLTTSAAGLSELQGKVAGRDDVTKQSFDEGIVLYKIKNRLEVYYFTTAEHPAHPTAIFRGRVTRADGSSGFDQRAWSASDNKTALKKLISRLEAKGTDEL